MTTTKIEEIQKEISELPYETIPEMKPPAKTVKTPPPVGYESFLDCYPGAPYFNASLYSKYQGGLRVASWLRLPATIHLLQASRDYYREAVRQKPVHLVMIVLGGRREVHGYYVHMSLFDAFASWCEHEKRPLAEQRAIPLILEHVF